MERSGYAFGDCVFDPGTGTLFRLDVPVPISFRGAQLLDALLKKTGGIVTKAELMDAAWPGVVVEESNLTNQIAALRKQIGGTADGEFIATVPRVGYRFVATVRWIEGKQQEKSRRTSQPAQARPSLAVLPFSNLSDDSGQQYFADGLAEDIIARLSQFRWLFLAARNSSFSYRARDIDVQRAGAELGVRYVMTGSVRRSDQRVRVIAQLSDTSTGGQIWTASFERELSSFLRLQDEITMSVVAALEPELYAAERQRLTGQSPESLDAWGLVMRALPLIWVWSPSEEILAAQRDLQSAVAIEPDYARANCLLAWTDAALAHAGQGNPTNALQQAEERTLRAMQLDPHDSWMHFAVGYVRMLRRDFEGAIEGLRQALELNPSFALAHMIMGAAHAYAGLSEDGLRHLAEASRVSPRDFSVVAIHSTAGLCHLLEGRHAEAIRCERRAVELRPRFVTAW